MGNQCPFCGERALTEGASRCPVCLGDAHASGELREHAWRNQDSRSERSDFERWLRGEFEISGLLEDVASDTNDAPHTAQAQRVAQSAPPQPTDSPGDEFAALLENEQAESAMDGDEAVDDDTHERILSSFSPGLSVQFSEAKRQPRESQPVSEAADAAVERRSERSGATTNTQPGHRPPVLIVEGPGPVIHEGRRAKSIVLRGDSVLIGRSSRRSRRPVDIDLVEYHDYDRLVARRHARLYLDRGIWFIEDLADNDATWIEGTPRPVNAASAPLRDGDRIRLGDSIRFRFILRS